MHSGDSACVLPPMSLGEEMLGRIAETTRALALELGVIGLINIQYAVAAGELYVIEANPRASRTVPFVSKAIGAPIAKIACRLMLGEPLADQDVPAMPRESRLGQGGGAARSRASAGADSVLGPEMKSTGEVMGVAERLPDRLRQGAVGRRGQAAAARARSSSPSPTTTRRPRPSSRPGSATSASASSRPAAPRRRSRGWASRSRRSTRSRRARRTSSTTSSAARSTSSSTRRPARAPAPTATRSAAPRPGAASPA